MVGMPVLMPTHSLYLALRLLRHLLVSTGFLMEEASSNGQAMTQRLSWRWGLLASALVNHKLIVTIYLTALIARCARAPSPWCCAHNSVISRILLYCTPWHHYWRRLGQATKCHITLPYISTSILSCAWRKRVLTPSTTFHGTLSGTYPTFCGTQWSLFIAYWIETHLCG